jgi:hypothetical protein
MLLRFFSGASARRSGFVLPARRAIARAAGVVVEQLEDRRLLSGVATLTAGVLTVTGTTQNDTVALSSSGGVYHVDLNGTGYDFSDPVTSVNVTLLDGDDLLTIDYTHDNPLPSGGITYDGGTGIQFAEDQLHIIGSAGNDSFNLSDAQTESGAGLIALQGVEVETIDGNGGDDTLVTGVGVFGNVAFDGGSGTDSFTYNASDASDNISIGAGHVNAIGFDETYSNIENLTINARSGNDTITGGIGVTTSPAVTINAGDGNDSFTITSGLGMVLNGEDGDDTLTLPANSVANVTFNGGSGTDTATQNSLSGQDSIYNITSGSSDGGGTNIFYSAIEGLTVNGQGFNDTFKVTSTASGTPLTLNGAGGDDTFNIGSGSLFVGLNNVAGPLTIDGGAGNDTLTIDDSTALTAEDYDITATTFARQNVAMLSYGAVEALTVDGSAGVNNITLHGTAPGSSLTVNGNDSDDSLAILNAPSGPVIFNGGTNPPFIDTLSLYDGAFTFDNDLSIGTARLFLEVNSATASVTFNSSQHLEGLILQNGGTATMAQNGSRFLSTNQLLIPSGDLDLKNNDLIVRKGTEGTWNGSAYSDILGLVQSGRNGGPWNGNGIRTSSAVHGNQTTLAVASASELSAGSFDGETLTGSEVLVKYTYGGDANLDGKVNIDDYGRIDAHVGQSGSVFGWYNGDFNYDGKINIDDYGIIDSVIGAQGPVL